MRYFGQSYELTIGAPEGRLDAADLDRVVGAVPP